MMPIFSTISPTVYTLIALLAFVLLSAALLVWAKYFRPTLQPVRILAHKAKQRKRPQPRLESLEDREVLDAAGMVAPELEAEPVQINGQTVNNVDLVALAKAISASGAKFYGAAWCPACTAQKELFGDGAKHLPFVEVTNPNKTLNQTGIDNNITAFPTWTFASGERVESVLDIDTLVEKSGVSITTSTSPYLEVIPDIDLFAGDPLHIALDGYSSSGEALTYTVSTTHGIVQTFIPEGNRSLQFDINGFGNMEFQLFEQRAGRATDRIIELAEDGFYDGLKFHRVIDNFMIQGGDPLGNGTGGSNLDDFDDQFHEDLRHNATGTLSMAKSFDDTNNSQFFITDSTPRHLDYQHTVFGLLTEGDANRQAITSTPVNGSDLPDFDVVMNSVSVFTDTENAVLMLDSIAGISGSDTITVTATDASGDSFSRTFQVNITPFSGDNLPFLNDIPDFVVATDSTNYYQLSGIDPDGQATFYLDQAVINGNNGQLPIVAPAGLDYSVDLNSGILEFTADSTAKGNNQFLVATANISYQSQDNTGYFDYQAVNVLVSDAPTLENDFRSIPEDSPLVFNPLDNDFDTDGTIDVTSLQLVSLPSEGELSINSATGVITFTPPDDFFGSVSFDYVATDNVGLAGNVATVTINVLAVDDGPVAVNDRRVVDENSGPVVWDVLGNDSSGPENEAAAGDILTIFAPTSPTHGTVLIVNNGQGIQYTPDPNFTGTDTFTYSAYDGTSAQMATVTVDVLSVTDFGLTLVTTPTTTDSAGAVASLPSSAEFVTEWDEFWVEVWVSAFPNLGTGVQSASLDLDYDQSMFVIDSIEYGTSFTDSQSAVIDNANGTISGLGASTSVVGLGATGRALLARVKFAPVSGGPGISAPLFGENIASSFSDFVTTDSLSMTLGGSGAVATPTMQESPSTLLLPMIYDLNDNGRIDISDLSLFIKSFNEAPNPTQFIDYDADGSGTTTDFISLINNFGFQLGINTPKFLTSFIEAQISGNPMVVSALTPAADSVAASLSTTDIQQLFQSALDRIPTPTTAPYGPSVPVSIQIVDLPGKMLGQTVGPNIIQIDINAAGYGWFIDATPDDNHEFTTTATDGQLVAIEGSEADARIDLLTVLMHELGHILQVQHAETGIMQESIGTGTRYELIDDTQWDQSVNLISVDLVFSELE
ncbi:MAG: peptidylprolyl isomerase [Pirellulales bacterium]